MFKHGKMIKTLISMNIDLRMTSKLPGCTCIHTKINVMPFARSIVLEKLENYSVFSSKIILRGMEYPAVRLKMGSIFLSAGKVCLKNLVSLLEKDWYIVNPKVRQ